jgi:hypothetical protein
MQLDISCLKIKELLDIYPAIAHSIIREIPENKAFLENFDAVMGHAPEWRPIRYYQRTHQNDTSSSN